MRTAAILIAVALLAGCGGSSRPPTASTTTPPPAPTQPAKSTAPKYVPSAHHGHRPPGGVYNDEIGESVLTAPYRRVIELFGPPASKHGACIRYRIVGEPKRQWEFCFKGQRMTGAGVVG